MASVLVSIQNSAMEADGNQCKKIIESSLQSVLPRFNIIALYKHQKQALFHLVCGKDVFVNLILLALANRTRRQLTLQTS